MATSERVKGPTPNGGAYAVAYFQDADGNAVDKKKATHVEIVEFNEAGEHVHRTYGTL